MALVISQEKKIRDRIAGMLDEFEVVECDDFLEAMSTLYQQQSSCNVVLADYDLDPFNGADFLKVVKSTFYGIRTVLMISGNDEEAETHGLRSEVDFIMEYEKADYINKTYIERLLDKSFAHPCIDGSELILDGVRIPLPRKEMEIVTVLLSNAGKAVSREEIISVAWEVDDGNTRKVDIHIKSIRDKILKKGFGNCITTVNGIGYKWIRTSLLV